MNWYVKDIHKYRHKNIGITNSIGKIKIISPKIILKQSNQFLSMKDVRGLLLNCLDPSGKQPRFAEFPVFPGVEQVNKVMFIDVPILDPHALELPLSEFFVSKKQTPEVYDKIKNSPIYDIVKQGDEESEILALVTASGFDQYKRVHDRFQDVLEVALSKGDIKKKREDEDKGIISILTT